MGEMEPEREVKGGKETKWEEYVCVHMYMLCKSCKMICTFCHGM